MAVAPVCSSASGSLGESTCTWLRLRAHGPLRYRGGRSAITPSSGTPVGMASGTGDTEAGMAGTAVAERRRRRRGWLLLGAAALCYGVVLIGTLWPTHAAGGHNFVPFRGLLGNVRQWL